jgi:two-component system, OmpR family, sensor histidine kinase KdpD
MSERCPEPEQLLGQMHARQRHERLKIFLGYASGVGKSFRMLEEGRRRRERGQDVVVGALQPARPPEIDRLAEALEVIPLKKLEGGEVLDVETILKRQPQVCLVDGAAYDNPPGSRHPQRWQDIMELVHSGVVVVTSLNLQHIQERQDAVERITGKRARQFVPESFLHSATEIVMVDVPPDLVLERAGGPGASEAQVAETQRKLSALREEALLLTAEVVDRQLEHYLLSQGIEQHWGIHERILVCLSPRSNAQAMISSGRRNAQRFHGELFVVYVRHSKLSEAEELNLQKHLELARQVNAHTEVLHAEEPVAAVMDFARAHGVTQIFVGHRPRRHWWNHLLGGRIDRLIRAAEGMDVRVFPD